MTKPPAKSRPFFRFRQPGFSLTELMVTLAIMAVLVGLAIPGWAMLTRSMKLSALTNNFLSQLHLARSEAIKRNSRVAMCKSVDGENCVEGGGWEQGWIVFHDVSNNSKRETDEPIIHQFAALPPGFHITGNKNVSRYVSFGREGETQLVSGAFQAGTLVVCKESYAEAREIIINSVGRPRIRKTTVPSCQASG